MCACMLVPVMCLAVFVGVDVFAFSGGYTAYATGGQYCRPANSPDICRAEQGLQLHALPKPLITYVRVSLEPPAAQRARLRRRCGHRTRHMCGVMLPVLCYALPCP